MRNRTIHYEADGLAMVGDLYVGEQSARKCPAILVFPEAFGLSEHARSRARRLAELGYVTLACDVHGRAEFHDDLETVMGLIGPLQQNPARTRMRAHAALQALLEQPEVDPDKIAAIGYCFGGTMALELARGGASIAAVVGFHSGLATVAPEDAAHVSGKVLVCIGADDPGVDADQRRAFEDEMRSANVDWQMSIYGGVVHSFTNPDAARLNRPDFARYDAKADARSWNEMLALFVEVFGQS